MHTKVKAKIKHKLVCLQDLLLHTFIRKVSLRLLRISIKRLFYTHHDQYQIEEKIWSYVLHGKLRKSKMFFFVLEYLNETGTVNCN